MTFILCMIGRLVAEIIVNIDEEFVLKGESGL